MNLFQRIAKILPAWAKPEPKPGAQPISPASAPVAPPKVPASVLRHAKRRENVRVRRGTVRAIVTRYTVRHGSVHATY
jgi:hypothetical protein